MEYLNSAQAQQLKEIGAYLQQKRQSLSMSIEEVAAETLIRAGILKAIEEGRLDKLPEPIFLRGFIRRYGDALHLDGDALAKTFSTDILPAPSDINPQKLPTLSAGVIPIYAIYSLLLASAVGGLLYILNKPRTEEAVVTIQKSPVAQQNKKVAKLVASVHESPLASVPSSPIQVTVNAKAQSWLRVIADGKTQFEDALNKGDNKTWTAKKQLTLRVGNAGAVAISYNGEEPKILGNVGEVKQVTFSPNH